MARKYSPKKHNNKIEPAVQTLTFYVQAPAGSSSVFLDVSQVASLVNRRFYRQGLNWPVAGFKILSNPGYTGACVISKLPNTWVMSNAWEKGFRAWQRMNNDALEENESVRPRFLDFKIYADSTHHALGFAGNILPVSLSGTYTLGEWEPSKVVVPSALNATAATSFSRELLATGASYPGPGASGLDSVSLIEGYASSRALPEIRDPNTPDDMVDSTGLAAENWLTAMFSDGVDSTDIVLDDMGSENNIAPYPFENDGVNTDTMYPGGANQGQGLQLHDSEYITGTTIGGTTRLMGGNFPCGLIRFDLVNNGDADILTLQMNLIPGKHRGYLCEPMTEM
jgi:hypothetical protein